MLICLYAYAKTIRTKFIVSEPQKYLNQNQIVITEIVANKMTTEFHSRIERNILWKKNYSSLRTFNSDVSQLARINWKIFNNN
ncbi:MAG: hypothetical protein A2X64_10085 [Ignavibacteria bacterium GWF2_33_9]|nr:MAG: hypothetical protein A2X64_10085 [Ignavibacteria bacterium GWF2_33_9]